VVAKIIFGRNVNGFLLTSCLPTIICDLVGHLTNFYFISDFEVATSVNLTLMLVITTMYANYKILTYFIPELLIPAIFFPIAHFSLDLLIPAAFDLWTFFPRNI
jgi:hypothetical protein